MKKIISSYALIDLILPHSFVKSSTYDWNVNWLSEIVNEHLLWLSESQWFLCVWWMYRARKITDTPTQRLDNIFSIRMNRTDIWYLIWWNMWFQAILLSKLKGVTPQSGLLPWKLRPFSLSVAKLKHHSWLCCRLSSHSDRKKKNFLLLNY